jgi:hypothetical protein
MVDALSELGPAEQVRQVFVGFQRHLYARPGPPMRPALIQPAL